MSPSRAVQSTRRLSILLRNPLRPRCPQTENIFSSCEVLVDRLVLQLLKVGGRSCPKAVGVCVIVTVHSLPACGTSPAGPSCPPLVFNFVPASQRVRGAHPHPTPSTPSTPHPRIPTSRTGMLPEITGSTHRQIIRINTSSSSALQIFN